MIWDILEIEKTEDLDAIKKAYAKKLAENHPEENPQKFQEIQHAYQAAVTYAKRANKGRTAPPKQNWKESHWQSEQADPRQNEQAIAGQYEQTRAKQSGQSSTSPSHQARSSRPQQSSTDQPDQARPSQPEQTSPSQAHQEQYKELYKEFHSDKKKNSGEVFGPDSGDDPKSGIPDYKKKSERQADYEKYKSIFQNEPADPEHTQELIKNLHSEIPEYIRNIGKQTESSFEAAKKLEQKEHMKKVLCLFEPDSKENYTKETKSLLTSDLFRAIALQDEFAKELKKLIGYNNFKHIKLILILQKEYSNLRQEYRDSMVAGEMDDFFTHIKKSYRKTKTAKIKVCLGIAVAIYIVVTLLRSAYLHSDGYMLRNAPDKVYVASLVKQHYGIEIDPEAILVETIDNPYQLNDSDKDRVRNYLMQYSAGESTINWNGLYTTNMDNPDQTSFNLEQEILDYYIDGNLEQYKNSDEVVVNSQGKTILPYEMNLFNKDLKVIDKQLFLKADRKEVEVFVDSFSEFIADMFRDPVVLSRDTQFEFTIYLYYPGKSSISDYLDRSSSVGKGSEETVITVSAKEHKIDLEDLKTQWMKSIEESEE